MINTKRIYEPKSESDGYRVLVDRLWPRGISKQKADIALWMKDIGPSNELRKWFAHDPAKWQTFQARYHLELKDKGQLLTELRQLEIKHKKITIVYSAHDEKHNQAVVLAEVLRN